MKLIKPSVEIIKQKDLFSHIELCGRVCYKSEDKITPDSSKKFIENLIKRGHTSVLEHGTIYLDRPSNFILTQDPFVYKYINNPYSKVSCRSIGNVNHFYVSTNYRVLLEHGWLDDLKYQCEPNEYHEKRVSVRFICDRGISHELVRHRVFSFSQESTRYCNYSKDKFGNELTFIIPCWFGISEGNYEWVNDADALGSDKHWNPYVGIKDLELNANDYLHMLKASEDLYNSLIKNNWTAQQARSILPNSLKTEVIMTGFISDWWRFFKLRCANSAHPQMRELAIPSEQKFKEL